MITRKYGTLPIITSSVVPIDIINDKYACLKCYRIYSKYKFNLDYTNSDGSALLTLYLDGVTFDELEYLNSHVENVDILIYFKNRVFNIKTSADIIKSYGKYIIGVYTTFKDNDYLENLYQYASNNLADFKSIEFTISND